MTAPSHSRRTVCPLDCPDTCGLDVDVANGRVEAVRESDGGFICGKVARFADRQHHDRRLRSPLRRIGPKGSGRFEPVSWDAALDETVARLRSVREMWGPEAIVPYHYGGSNGLLTDGSVDALFFERLGASRLARTICAAPATAVANAMYGKMPGTAYEDFPAARCIIVWGANPKGSGIHLVPYLRQAKAAGAFIAVVDPRRTFSSREIDLHLPVLPGADLPLALGMIRWWREAGGIDEAFLRAHATPGGAEVLLNAADAWSLERTSDVTGLDCASIEELAGRYLAAEPALIRLGWGTERNRNGGQAMAAILAIPALLGKFGRRGGGYTLSNNGSVRATTTLAPSTASRRELNMTQLADWLHDETLDPPVRALMVYNCNPVATVPDQRRVVAGLSREDLFTVVLEQVHTDTVPFADIVLPATTFLEHYDVRVGYGRYRVGGVVPVVPREGSARSNREIFAALARRLGWDDATFGETDAEAFARELDALEFVADRPSLAAAHAGGVASLAFRGRTPIAFETVFPGTGDRRIDLAPSVLGATPYRFDPVMSDGHPLTLISPASARLISSTFGESSESTLLVTIHPDDARDRGVAHGDRVAVYNDQGRVECRARVDTRVRRGVVSIPKGAWRRSSLNGFTSTALCPSTVNVVAGGACFNDARVEVERIP